MFIFHLILSSFTSGHMSHSSLFACLKYVTFWIICECLLACMCQTGPISRYLIVCYVSKFGVTVLFEVAV